MKKDGIILLNKVKGISSFKAINQIKWNIGASKIGHAGTLDPMAEGLMVVMVNSATKFSEDLMKKDKEYYVEMELGYETDTYDAEGKKTKIYDGIIEYDEQNVRDVINSFVGIQDQIPPMYSALKVNGRKMYEMAREGIEIERKPRRVEIYSIRDITIKGEMITFYVEVSSGTYIRSLVRDIGEKLSFFATMTKLIRTKIDKYSLENAFLFEEIEKSENKEELIIDIESLFDYEHIILSKNELLKLSNGMTTILELSKHAISNMEDLTNKKLKVYSSNNEFVGIANILKFDESNMFIKRDKYFVLNPNIST
ncbi:MAG: tRNA pseudouridine(55) synthase TruB [Leptotrichiaceae bacterium]